MDIIALSVLLEAGEPVFLRVRSFSDAVHDVDDLEVGDACAVK